MKQFYYKLCVAIGMTILSNNINAQQSGELIEVAAFGHNQPIGVAVAPQSNRLFVSFPHKEPFLYGLTEIVDGKRIPYPNAEWNRYIPEQSDTHFVNVQDLHADDQNCLWILDSSKGKFKLLKIDLATNKVVRIYKFEDLPKSKSALNDVCIDNSRNLAYLSDPGLQAIIILDLKSGLSKIVLQGDRSTMAQPGFRLHLNGKDVIDGNGNPFVSNVNGIALTNDHEYFYFRAINQTKLYRIRTSDLTNITLSKPELSDKVEMVAETGICHGMIADQKGNVYLSNSADQSIQYVSPNKTLHTLVKDERLIWPDSFGIGSNGYLFVSSSQMNLLPKYNNGKDKVKYPYRVYKVKLPE